MMHLLTRPTRRPCVRCPATAPKAILQLLMLLTSGLLGPGTALAAAAPAAGGGGFFPPEIIMLALFVAIFYFMIWRPSAKQRKEREELLSSLEKGVEVITAGGLTGTLVRVEADFVMIRVANGIEFRFSKSSVTATLPKGTLKHLEGESKSGGKGGKRNRNRDKPASAASTRDGESSDDGATEADAPESDASSTASPAEDKNA